jgi:predicted Zn-dependent protease
MRILRSLLLASLFISAPSPFSAYLLAQQSAEDLARQGQEALAAGRFDAAETAFAALAKREPTVAEVHATLGAIYFQEGKFDLAVESLRHALKLKPSLARAKVLLAICLSESGKSAEALPGLQSGFRSSDDAEVRRRCGLELLRAYSATHHDEEAVETALALNKQYPADAEILYQTARIYGNFAFLTMQALRQRAPDSIWMAQARAEANESQKAYDAAIAAYRQVLSMDANRPGIHYRLGRIYLARFEETHHPEDRDAAQQEFSEELTIDPGNGNAGYELAQIFTDSGKLDEAGKQFQQVVRRFPDFEQALVGLGRVYFESEKPAEAVAPLERATVINSSDEVAWYRLAQAQRAAGNREAAQKALDVFRKLHAAPPAVAGNQPAEEITPQRLPAEQP